MKKIKKVLICIDMQNDFIYGPLGTPEAREIVPKVVRKVKEEVKNPDTVVLFTADMHGEDYLNTLEGKYLPIEHAILGTDGCKIIRELREIMDSKSSGRGFNTLIEDIFGVGAEQCVTKDTFGVAQWDLFLDWICDDEDVVIELIGVDTDICVVSNALILRSVFKDNEIVVDASCCAGSTPERHKAALEVMKSCQINVIGE